MEDRDYYVVLAKRICFDRIDWERFEQIVKYKSGKKMIDIAHAVNRGRTEACGDIRIEFDRIAKYLSEVLEIDTSQPLEEFRKK